MTEPMTRPRYRDMMWIALLAVGMDALVAVYIGNHRSKYLDDYGLNSNPDAKHYVLLGRNFWERGAYSRMDRPPYTPDVLRTPVYPLVAGGLNLASGRVWTVYLMQAACRALMAVSVYGFGAAVVGRRVAFLAGLLIAGDLSLSVLDFETMSEPLFDLLVTVGVLLWIRPFALPFWLPSIKVACSVGILLGLSILTRPAGLYLPLVAGVGWVLLGWVRQNKRYLVPAVILVVMPAMFVLPWIARNAAVFGITRVSTADSINLIYFAGAGAYAWERGESVGEAQEQIAKENGIISLAQSNNMWTVDKPVRELDSELRAVTTQVLQKYPRSLVLATLCGIGKSLVSHNVYDLADMAGQDWHAPGLALALRGNWAAFGDQLKRNEPFLIAAFIYQTLFALVTVSLAGIGAIIGLTVGGLRGPTVALMAVTAYYLLTIAVVGLDAYQRHRSALIPLCCLFAAVAVGKVCGHLPNGPLKPRPYDSAQTSGGHL